MIPQNSIPDVFLLDLERTEGRLVLLRDTDHLLRRFGQVENRNLTEGEETSFLLRKVADEIWSVIAGEVTLTLVDKREGSPSENKSMRIKLSEIQPKAVLVPFGIAYHISAQKNAQMIRISTHADGTHSDDQILPSNEFDSILSTQ
jgi:hypothetical protein